MFQKVRITVGSIAVIALCLLSSTFTLSYFTDTADSVNNFKIGNAASTLSIFKDSTGETPFNASEYTLTPNMPNIPFYLEAENTGNIPVYQRFRVVIPAELNNRIELVTSENNAYTITHTDNVYYIVSNNVLAVNETTEHWPTTAIHIVDLTGIDTSQFTCSDNTNNNCVIGVSTYSDVIQTTGFASAEDAFTNLDNNN